MTKEKNEIDRRVMVHCFLGSRKIKAPRDTAKLSWSIGLSSLTRLFPWQGLCCATTPLLYSGRWLTAPTSYLSQTAQVSRHEESPRRSSLRVPACIAVQCFTPMIEDPSAEASMEANATLPHRRPELDVRSGLARRCVPKNSFRNFWRSPVPNGALVCERNFDPELGQCP